MEFDSDEERLRLVMDVIQDGVYDWNLLNNEIYFSPRWKAMLGYDADELEPSPDTWFGLLHPDDRDDTRQLVEQYVERGNGRFEALFRLRHKQGRYVSVLSRGALFRDTSGRGCRMVGLNTDITAACRQDEARIRQEQFHQVLLSEFPFAAWHKDRDGRYQASNRKLAEYLGIDSPEQMLGKTVHEFFQSDVADEITSEIEQVLTNGVTVHTEKCFPVAGGERWFDIYQSPVITDGRLTGIAGCAWDITEQKLVEQAFANSEERYRRVVEVSPDAIFIHCNGRFVFMNLAAAKLLGAETPEQLYGSLALDFVNSDQKDQVAQRIRNAWLHNDNPLIEEELLRLDGSVVSVEMVSVYLNYNGNDSVLAIARDISERKRMQDELVKSQKLESLGVLAGGIAHDFNNLLTAIIGNADLAIMHLNRESPIIGNLRMIEDAAAKAADLARQMLAYSGRGKFVIEQINVNVLLEEMTRMLEVSITQKALLRLDLAPHLPDVEADATQLRQVIMNLVINASEAIGEKSGVIAITTGCMDCDKSYLKDIWLVENISEGLYIYLEVADSGCGMDSETVAKIFEPFFTTKFTGRGLGMAAVMGIIRGHKGAIKVYSEPGRGSSFKILLPASGKPAELFNHEAETDNWTGSGLALLVDDEETVRGIGKAMLQELGFQVITACDGREALEVFQEHPDICLVVLDLTMPLMDGEQCFRELRLAEPGIKVIMSSGYNQQEVTRKLSGKGLSGFIQKPYRLSALKAAIMATELPGE